MRKSIKWMLALLAVVLVFIGISVLYRRLAGDYAPGGLETAAPVSTAPESPVPGTAGAGDTEPESTGSESTVPESPANPAPGFTVYDGAGKPVSLASLRGRPVVLNFWASWCYYCKEEMPDFEEMYRKYGDEVVFLMVNATDGYQETVASAKKYLAGRDFTFPVYYDTAYEATSAYAVTGLPATYFIDVAGGLVAHRIGLIDAGTLEQGIRLIAGD